MLDYIINFIINERLIKFGASAKEIEIIIRKFEDNLIDENKFAETLNLFNFSVFDIWRTKDYNLK